MIAAVVALGGLTIIIALIVIAWAVRALFFRDLGQRARPRGEPPPECQDCPDHVHAPRSLRQHYGTLGDSLKTSPAPFPYAAAPLREQAPGDRGGGGHPPLEPPPLHHDAFRWPQRWHEPVERASLPPVTGPAIRALAILTAPVAAHLEQVKRARAEEWDAYVRETRPWDDDTGTLTAICADVMDGA